MVNKETPFFIHDCEYCTFLGIYNLHDLYFCGYGGDNTVLARYSNDGPDYKSGITFAHERGDKELYEAKKRAIKLGLL